MTLQEQQTQDAQEEIAWAQRYEALAELASDPQSKAEFMDLAKAAREAAAMLMEGAQP